MAIEVKDLHGSRNLLHRRWGLAIVAEGFTRDELADGTFDEAAMRVVRGVIGSPPFAGLADSIVIVSVAVESVYSSTLLGEQPADRCTPPSTLPAGFHTFFGARFCRGSPPVARTLWGDSALVISTVRSQPGLNYIQNFAVIVNNEDLHGGTQTGAVSWFSMNENYADTAVHELGHRFGLWDEYEIDEEGDPPRSYPSSVFSAAIDAKNVTTATTMAGIKWRELLTTPRLPTTRHNDPCAFNHPVFNSADANAVGLFEGGGYHACGIYRPELNCTMREKTVRTFCRACDRVIRLQLANDYLGPRRVASSVFGDWTHVLQFTWGAPDLVGVGPVTRLLAYNMTSGGVAIYHANYVANHGDNPVPVSPAGRLVEAGCSSVVTAKFMDTIYFIFTDLATNRQFIKKLDDSGRDLVDVWQGQPLTLGFTHLVALSGDVTAAYLAYNTFTGAVTIRKWIHDDPADSEPREIASGFWEPMWTCVESFTILRGTRPHAYVLLYQWTSGRVKIMRIENLSAEHPTIVQAYPPLPYDPAPMVWAPNQTHLAALDVRHDRYLLRYSALDGWASLHHPRTEGSGVDWLWGGYPREKTPRQPEAQFGIGALTMLGVGTPAFGAFPLTPSSPGDDSEYRLWFYNSATGRMNLYAFA